MPCQMICYWRKKYRRSQTRDFGLERKGGRESGEREGKKAEKGGGKKGEKRRGKIYKRDAKSCILEWTIVK